MAANFSNSLVFIVVLSIPLITMNLPLCDVPESDVRTATQFPTTPDSATSAPTKVGDRFEARFPFRKELTSLHHLCAITIGPYWSPRDEVLIGKDGWLFLSKYPASNPFDNLAYYLREDEPLTKTELDSWTDAILERQHWLEERGIQFLFAVAPNKHTIYPECMPDNLVPKKRASRCEQLLSHLNASGVHAMFLKDCLLQAKKQWPVYWKTDTHWNEPGSYVAAHAVADELGLDLKIPMLDQIEVEASDTTGRDLAHMLSLSSYFTDTQFNVHALHGARWSAGHGSFGKLTVAMNNGNEEGCRIVMFHDSFGDGMIPYLAENSRRFVSCYYGNCRFDKQLILTEKPDIVIILLVERYLMRKGRQLREVPFVFS